VIPFLMPPGLVFLLDQAKVYDANVFPDSIKVNWQSQMGKAKWQSQLQSQMAIPIGQSTIVLVALLNIRVER